MIRACVFDLDGTLCDSVRSMGGCVNRMLEDFGYPPIEMHYFNIYVGDGVHRLIVRVTEHLGLPESMVEPMMKRYLERFEEECLWDVTPYEGIPKMLRTLKEQNISLAVLSNKPHRNTVKVIHAVFGEDIFDVIQGQQEGIPRKPDPTGALLEAEELQVKPEECLYIGDTGTDMDTGNAAGMHTVGVLWGFRDEAELRAHGAAHTIAKPEELMALLEKMREKQE